MPTPSDARSLKNRTTARKPTKADSRSRKADSREPSPGWTAYLACALLALATIVAYSNTLQCPFVFDDTQDIVENRSIRRLWPIWRVFVAESAGRTFVHSRPVVNLSLAVDYAIGGLDTLPYHLTNLGVHVLAGLTLLGIVRRTLCLPALAERYGAAATPLALVIAGVWMLHPLQTAAVTYIIQRYESMMGLFYLLSLYCVIRSDASPRPRWWSGASVVACLAAMGSKEVAVSIPLVILLYDRAFLAGSFQEAWRRRRGMYLGLAGAWVAMAVHLAFSGGRGDWAGFGLPFRPIDYAKSQFGVILHYLRLSVWPYPQVFDYDWPVAAGAFQIVPAAVVVLGLLAATVYALVRWPKWGTLGAWFFLILAPTSSIMPIADMAFEHRMYLSLAAVAAGAVIAAHAGLERLSTLPGGSLWGRSRLRLVPALALLGALGAATYLRNQVYRSEWSVWNDVAQKAPNNPRAHYNLGVIAQRQGRTEEAIARYQLALKIEPRYYLAHTNLADILSAQGRTDEAIARYQLALKIEPRYFFARTNLANLLYAQGQGDEAVAHYQKALDFNPQLAEPHFNLGNVLRRQGNVPEAMRHYESALTIDPHFAEAHINLANLLYRQGKVDEAIDHYQEALESDPRSAQTHTNLAIALLAQGKIDAAIAHGQTALEIKPQSAEVRCELGKAFCRKGRNREAIVQWSEAIRLRPQDTTTVNALARLLATSPDNALRNGAEAVRLAEHAVRLSDAQVPELLDTLAAAYAEAGRFADALQAANRALQLAAGKKDSALADAVRARIRLYQAGTPLRDAGGPSGDLALPSLGGAPGK